VDGNELENISRSNFIGWSREVDGLVSSTIVSLMMGCTGTGTGAGAGAGAGAAGIVCSNGGSDTERIVDGNIADDFV
jgi:hypothetical protein